MKLSALIPLALAASASVASAQFTTVTRPAPRAVAVDSAPIRAQRDSVARVTLTDLRTWVDSAANMATISDDSAATSDTAATVAEAAPRPAAAEPRRTTAFSEGAVAPATASPLPFFALLGLAAMGVGALLLRRKRA